MNEKIAQKLRSGTFQAALIGIWAIVVAVPLSFLMASHILPLPNTPVLKRTSAYSENLFSNTSTSQPRWTAVHILVADCPCSTEVASHLISRGASQEMQENVWVVGGTAPWETALMAKGFKLEHREAEEVARESGVEGGPWLQLIAPSAGVVYSGGYSEGRPRCENDFKELALFRALKHGIAVETYPAFGCAASQRLKKKMDPFGLKRFERTPET